MAGTSPGAVGNSGWINPGSYLLMGQQRMVNGPGGHAKVLGGTAILQKALVSGPEQSRKPAAAGRAPWLGARGQRR